MWTPKEKDGREYRREGAARQDETAEAAAISLGGVSAAFDPTPDTSADLGEVRLPYRGGRSGLEPGLAPAQAGFGFMATFTQRQMRRDLPRRTGIQVASDMKRKESFHAGARH